MTTRECKACDGCGYVERFTWSGWLRCDACGGSGSITDRIPASDAITDAETLSGIVSADCLAADTYDVSKAMLSANGLLYALRRLNQDVIAHSIPSQASYAASKAFRAVPGLRG